ncbi:MAG TPA: bifunctional [glutamine synthetase] adenylyltransferase/[glutamine synthetase]-adenylyl-L-tyrosine phosphorylase [Acidimicrobiales bacterium]|nr:bifunctional [glutamine synthetase] adenylyltransferase/[glutamine synthetase]-adenylyl-L-tyrosine phosphorylase [Acidimicrobiales bacterium]
MAELTGLVERSADPRGVRDALERLRPEQCDRLQGDADAAATFVAVVAASRSLTRLLLADDDTFDVLTRLDDRPAFDGDDGDALARWKQHELLRIAARDLTGRDGVEATTGALSDLATDVLRNAIRLTGAEELAVVGMGKLGGHELNYASDIDLLFVGGDVRQARAVMDLARRCYRVDANLRPEGRDGPLTRSVDSYAAYWQRWATPWEFQALLKAIPLAGAEETRRAWAEAADAALWSRPVTTDDLRSLRALKARAEAAVVRQGIADREVKRSPGGIRDIEFSVQLLQLVHGRADPALRSPTTLDALGELSASGYVGAEDADGLADAYRFLRRVEHALQLSDEQQTHTLPADREERRRIARVLGYRGTPEAGPTEAFDRELTQRRNLVRSIHERLYFRPLLDALAGVGPLSPEAAAAALTTFGFSDVERTRQAVAELTRGLTRSSRMMQQVLPLMLDWLSATPDPDAGLLGLRKLATGEQRTTELAVAFRDSPEVARHLSMLLGTSALFGDLLAANPDLIVRLADPNRLRTRSRAELQTTARDALGWRSNLADRQRALRRWQRRQLLGIAARDVFGQADVAQVGADLTTLAEASLGAALRSLEPGVRFTVIALGRFAGGELAYASDLDVVFVHDGDGAGAHEEALRAATGLLRFVAGDTPAQRVYRVDTNLRPEGRQGPLCRSISGYASYFDRWALTWERQAMARARPVAGDPELGERFMALLDRVVWDRPFTDDDEREVRRMKARVQRERLPPGEDPEFHLKLGRGSLADIEWTVQLLQLRHGVRGPGTIEGLDRLAKLEVVTPGEVAVLRDAYRFCERTRNRWWLVGADPVHPDALPQGTDDAARLARSLGAGSAGVLRDDYRRVTRRARRVVERLFYGMP